MNKPGEHSRDFYVSTALLALCGWEWAIDKLYHGVYGSTHSIPDFLIAIFSYLTVILFLKILKRDRLIYLFCRFLSLCFCSYIFRDFGAALLSAIDYDRTFIDLVLVFVALAFATLLAARLQASQWRRLGPALVTACLLYLGLPVLLAGWSEPVQLGVPSRADHQGATVILLLDELSVEKGFDVAESLMNSGARVQISAIKSVGKNTINVIPAIFGGYQMEGARVCTATAVCGDFQVFDFKKVQFKAREKFHVVGFYFPYCSVKGLSSCTRLNFENSHRLAKLACRTKNLFSNASAGACAELGRDGWLELRARAQHATFNSPFWERGGVLFAHLPFPHPPGRLNNADLAADYEDSVQIAAEIAAQIWRKGSARFGRHFRLIVLSDHPLRSELHCASPIYVRKHCRGPVTYFPYQVPYISASTDAGTGSSPSDNTDLFLRRHLGLTSGAIR